ncbi:hypothetical protein ACLKA6_000012 [Drosophila palustris]
MRQQVMKLLLLIGALFILHYPGCEAICNRCNNIPYTYAYAYPNAYPYAYAAYSAPSYAAPVYAAPGYAAPVYAAPSYAAPIYAASYYG